MAPAPPRRPIRVASSILADPADKPVDAVSDAGRRRTFSITSDHPTLTIVTAATDAVSSPSADRRPGKLGSRVIGRPSGIDRVLCATGGAASV